MLLHRVIDLWPICHILATIVVMGLVATLPLWIAIPLLLVSSTMAGVCVAIAHNHTHAPMFRWQPLNVVTDLVLQQVTGFPALGWKSHHLRSHHQSPWTDRDFSSPYSFQGADRPLSPVSMNYFQLTYMPLFWCDSLTFFLRRAKRSELIRLAASLAVFATVHVLIISWIGIWRWLLLFVPTYAFCGKSLGSDNYLQHWACEDQEDPESPFEAWTFTCPFYNALTFNQGYHSLHHHRPSLHWSDLAKSHRLDSSYTRPQLIEDGLFPGFRGGAGLKKWLEQTALQPVGPPEPIPAEVKASQQA